MNWLDIKGHGAEMRVLCIAFVWLAVLLGSGMLTPSVAACDSSQTASVSGTTSQESVDPEHCGECHASQVDGFARTAMAHSMRIAGKEPQGLVSSLGATVRITNDAQGTWQELQAGDDRVRRRIDFVIGSGKHAQGYLTAVSDHLFQSPVAYYTKIAAYGLAPGFEKVSDPDFSRVVTPACLFCHAGGTFPVAGTRNEYQAPIFRHLSITCDRCHGSTQAHLQHPQAGNIVNPEQLRGAARDSVCEQCHLIGVARILNPGKTFADFRAGAPLEETFTIYRQGPIDGKQQDFRVISHSEQLAQSACARNSTGRLWCGTCHDPHDEPTKPIAFFRDRCLSCHSQTVFPKSHPSKDGNCIGCHMPRRDAVDGGHTTFTDHRIQRVSGGPTGTTTSGEITPWREPREDLRDRNLGLALVGIGIERRSTPEVIRGYKLLAGVQDRFQTDSELFDMIGNALLAGRQNAEAAKAFEIAVRLDPNSSSNHASLGNTYAALGEYELAQRELERALTIDPLNLDAVRPLIDIYDRRGNSAAAMELASRFSRINGAQKEKTDGR